MHTLPLFHVESWEDALEADVHALGGPKVVGEMLWPHLGPIDGGKKLRRIVNKEHKQRLNEEEKAFIIREAARRGSRRLVEYYCKLGRAKAIPIAPEDEKEKVVELYESIRKPALELYELIHDIERRHGDSCVPSIVRKFSGDG